MAQIGLVIQYTYLFGIKEQPAEVEVVVAGVTTATNRFRTEKIE